MEVKVCCEQFKEMLGIVRISQIFIETNGFSDDKKSTVVFNTLAEKIYFTENNSWKSQVKEDVAKEIGCDITDIDVQY